MHHSQHPFPRSVHNSWIERIWYDVTEGFGGKWKDMFIDLEANYGLDINNAAHICHRHGHLARLSLDSFFILQSPTLH